MSEQPRYPIDITDIPTLTDGQLVERLCKLDRIGNPHGVSAGRIGQVSDRRRVLDPGRIVIRQDEHVAPLERRPVGASGRIATAGRGRHISPVAEQVPGRNSCLFTLSHHDRTRQAAD